MSPTIELTPVSIKEDSHHYLLRVINISRLKGWKSSQDFFIHKQTFDLSAKRIVDSLHISLRLVDRDSSLPSPTIRMTLTLGNGHGDTDDNGVQHQVQAVFPFERPFEQMHCCWLFTDLKDFVTNDCLEIDVKLVVVEPAFVTDCNELQHTWTINNLDHIGPDGVLGPKTELISLRSYLGSAGGIAFELSQSSRCQKDQIFPILLKLVSYNHLLYFKTVQQGLIRQEKVIWYFDFHRLTETASNNQLTVEVFSSPTAIDF